MEFTIPSQYTKYTTIGYDSAKTPVWRVSSSGLPGLAISYSIEAVSLGNDQYAYGRTDKFEVKEREGDKEIFVERGHQIIGYSLTFTDQHEATYAYGGEVDIQFHSLNTNGVGHHVNLTLTDANGKSVALRTNLSYKKSTGEMSMYAEPPSGSDRIYAPASFKIKAGDILTFRGEVDRENKVLKLFANGRYIGDIALEAFSAYKNAIDTFDVTTAYVTKLSVHAISSAKDDVTIDNVVFIKGEEIIVEETPEGEENGGEEVVE